MGWQREYKFEETHAKGVYLCQSRDKEYITCQFQSLKGVTSTQSTRFDSSIKESISFNGSCTCGSWTEQVGLSEWLMNEGIEYSPICKHQMMLAIGLSNPKPRKPAHTVMWELDGDVVHTWITRDNRTVSEFKEFNVRDFASTKVTSICNGWNFTRRSNNGLEVLSTTSKGKRR